MDIPNGTLTPMDEAMIEAHNRLNNGEGLSDGFKGGAEWKDKQGETFNEVSVSTFCDDKKEISMKLTVEGTSLASLKNGEKVTVLIRRNNEMS